MGTWEEVKNSPDDKILVYHINGSVKLLPGIVREISTSGQRNWPEYHFAQVIDNAIYQVFHKDELLFFLRP